jgi:hypothetical protein
MQLFVTVDNWTGFIGDVWCGQLRSTRAASSATEMSTEAKLIGQRLRGRQAATVSQPTMTTPSSRPPFEGTCHVKLRARLGSLANAVAIDALIDSLLHSPLIAVFPPTWHSACAERQGRQAKEARRQERQQQQDNKVGRQARLPPSPSRVLALRCRPSATDSQQQQQRNVTFAPIDPTSRLHVAAGARDAPQACRA